VHGVAAAALRTMFRVMRGPSPTRSISKSCLVGIDKVVGQGAAERQR
jgi:hypothetical protein